MLINNHGIVANKMNITEPATLKTPFKSINTRIISDSPGRLRLRVAPSDRQASKMQHIAHTLEAQPNIDRVRINIPHGSILIHHNGKEGSQKNIMDTLVDLGIIFANLTEGNSEAATDITNAVVDLNSRVEQLTQGAVDLRFLFPLGLSFLAVRQLLTKGLQLELIPWYVLAWYAFDSFIKLHRTSEAQPRMKDEV